MFYSRWSLLPIARRPSPVAVARRRRRRPSPSPVAVARRPSPNVMAPLWVGSIIIYSNG